METWYNRTFFNCLPDPTLRGNDEVRKLETEILTVSKTDWNERRSVILRQFTATSFRQSQKKSETALRILFYIGSIQSPSDI